MPNITTNHAITGTYTKKTRVGTLYYILSHTIERKLQNNEPLHNENSGQKITFFTPVI